MNFGKGSSKIPHHLRIVIFLLRLVIGLSFVYAVAFDKLQTPEQWAFFVLGLCITVGLFTVITSLATLVLLVWNFLPTVNTGALDVVHFVNDQVIVMVCLLILIFANAGKYIGLDSFIHIRRPGKNSE